MARQIRLQRRTLLIVGEGDCEVAFLRYLRGIYCSQNASVNVTIRNAQGGGPDSVVNHLVRQLRLAKFDRQIALLDTDIAWSMSLQKIAKQNKIEMIGSKPCLEGLLLSVLDQPIPASSGVCKKNLQRLTKADMTESRHYAPYFPKETFEQARLFLAELDILLRYFEGG